MCGICGILYFDHRPVPKGAVSSMNRTLVHRGPDDEGCYFSESKNKGNVGLGFRRLSIIDVAGGHQPMRHKNQVIVFNGEIYNFKQLKTECESRGHQFSTESDTEVLLRLYNEYAEKCLENLNGMFAFAVWDEESRDLFLARDRLGIKPLYYFSSGSKFIFASEIKALVCSGEVPLEFDPEGMSDYLAHRFVPGPHTVLKNVKKVLPGHFISVKNGQVKESPYWSVPLDEPRLRGQSVESLEEELLDLLEKSVKAQLVSDVPLGAFLSGGVDSSLVTALMARNSKQVKTFSIGFEKTTGVDESPHAQKVAQFLGTEHRAFILTSKDLSRSDSIFSAMTEPVADPTILPTAILAEFARKEVKVALTGEGGDELFAGYNRYKAVLYSQWVKKFPPFLQPLTASVFRHAGKGECFRAIPKINSENWFSLNRDFDRKVLQEILNAESMSRSQGYLPSLSRSYFSGHSANDPLNAVLELERRTSLVDRLLMKVDMATMGQSLEARPPFLDHRIVEFSFRVPSEYKIRFFKGKYLLRKAAAKLLPAPICWRRKHGFILPIAQWVKAHPREWLHSVLSKETIDAIGLFDVAAIQNKAEKIYNSEGGQESSLLWPVIVLSCWLKSIKKECAPS